MPQRDINELAQQLHAAGAINLETKISDVLKVAGIGDLNPGGTVASTAVAWDGYVIVYKGMPAGLSELPQVVREAGGGGR
jgi:hypothetical protein